MHNFMRKIAAIMLAGMLCVSLSGCSSGRDVWLETGSEGTEVSEEKVKGAEDLKQENASKDTSSDEKKSGQHTEDARKQDPGQRFFVYICGQVNRPGVYEVDAQARIYQLVELAGGLTKEADTSVVNQAQLLTDGQMIYIPAVGEHALLDESSGSKDGTGTEKTSQGKVNINTAGVEQLTTLTGIGEGKAQSIIAYREEQGGFQSIEEIMNVEGIKEGTYQKIKDQIMV